MSNTLFKKSVAGLSAAALVLTAIAPVSGVKANNAQVDAANYLGELGIINHHSANPSAYRLGDSITRGEMAKVMIELASEQPKASCEGKFSDVSATAPNDWVCGYVEKGLELGMLSANPTFRPNDTITNAEALRMVMGARSIEVSFTSANWQQAYVNKAIEKGIINSAADFGDVNAVAVRGNIFSAAAATHQVTSDDYVAPGESDGGFNLEDLFGDLFGDDKDETPTTPVEDKDDKDNTSSETTTPVVTGGNVEVTLNPASPMSQSIPSSGMVTFGKYDFTAGSNDVSINSIELKREGLGQRSDISRVYFERDGVRVGSRASVNVDEKVIITFAPALVIKAGSTTTLDLVVDLDAANNVGGEHSFSLLNVESSANLQGNLPVRTSTMRTSNYEVKEITFAGIAGEANVNINNATKLYVGDKNVIIGEFEIQTDGDRDNVFRNIEFRNNGSADLETMLSNVSLYRDGSKVSTHSSISGRNVSFVLNDKIENGRTEKYEIRADIVSLDRTSETIQLQVRNNTDLRVVEATTGFSAPVKFANTANSQNLEGFVVEGGELVLTRDASVTNSATVSASTNDVVLLSGNVRVDEAITVEDLKVDFNITKTGTAATLSEAFRDIRLVIDGRTVSTYSQTNNNRSGEITFDGTYQLPAGNSKIQILGNLRNNVPADNLITFGPLDLNKAVDVRYVSNDEKATINGSVAGVQVTIGGASVIITKNDGISSTEVVVSGARDVELFGFSLRANDVSDLRLGSLRFNDSYSGANFSVSNVNNIRLYEGNTLLSTSNDFNFTSLNVNIPRNGSKSFRVVADFDSSISTGREITLSLRNENQINLRNLASNELLRGTAFNTNDNVLSSSIFRFVESGTITLNRNSSTRGASIITPSNTETDVFSFEVEAKDDKLRITDLYLDNVANGDKLNLAESVRSASLSVNGKVYTGDAISADRLYFAIGNNNPIIVDRNETVRIDVKLALNDSTSRQNAELKLAFPNDSTNQVAGSRNGIRIISDSTGTELAEASITRGTNLQSESHVYSRTAPVVTMGNASTNEQRFRVAVSGGSRLDLNEVHFRIETQGGAALNQDLVNALSGATFTGSTQLELLAGNRTINNVEYRIDGNILKVKFTNAEQISSGTNQEFTLRGFSRLINEGTQDRSSREVRVEALNYSPSLQISGSVNSLTVNSDDKRFDNTGIPTSEVRFNY